MSPELVATWVGILISAGLGAYGVVQARGASGRADKAEATAGAMLDAHQRIASSLDAIAQGKADAGAMLIEYGADGRYHLRNLSPKRLTNVRVFAPEEVFAGQLPESAVIGPFDRIDFPLTIVPATVQVTGDQWDGVVHVPVPQVGHLADVAATRMAERIAFHARGTGMG